MDPPGLGPGGERPAARRPWVRPVMAVAALGLVGAAGAGVLRAMHPAGKSATAQPPTGATASVPFSGLLPLGSAGGWARIRRAEIPRLCVTAGSERSRRYPSEVAVQRNRRRNGHRPCLHRDQILRRDPVSDLRPVTPARQMLEPTAGERHRAGRQTETEVTPQVTDNTLDTQHHAQLLSQRRERSVRNIRRCGGRGREDSFIEIVSKPAGRPGGRVHTEAAVLCHSRPAAAGTAADDSLCSRSGTTGLRPVRLSPAKPHAQGMKPSAGHDRRRAGVRPGCAQLRLWGCRGRQPTAICTRRASPTASLLPQRCTDRRYIGRTVRMSCSPRVVMVSKSLRAMAAKLVG